MAASRPSYAPSAPRHCLPPAQRLVLRVRHRARRRWSVRALLDERRDLLAALDALERARSTTAAKLRQRAAEKPAARDIIEQSSRTAQARIELHAERVRHRLLLDDGVLSAHGVRPWEDVPS